MEAMATLRQAARLRGVGAGVEVGSMTVLTGGELGLPDAGAPGLLVCPNMDVRLWS